jgi:hypothetical protein
MGEEGKKVCLTKGKRKVESGKEKDKGEIGVFRS